MIEINFHKLVECVENSIREEEENKRRNRLRCDIEWRTGSRYSCHESSSST